MIDIGRLDFSHPAFRPYVSLIGQLGGQADIKALNALAARRGTCHDNGKPIRFEVDGSPHSAASYETAIFRTGRVPTRDGHLHDLLNAVVWLRFPRLKSALNTGHCQMLEREAELRQRGKVRDQLTLLDESGVLVASPAPDLLALLSDKRWVELFWERRAESKREMSFVVVGHGLLEKCLKPFAGMTGKCLLMETAAQSPEALDPLAAGMALAAAPLTLPPLPILGIPDWADNDARQYYLNTEVFRPGGSVQGAPPQTNR